MEDKAKGRMKEGAGAANRRRGEEGRGQSPAEEGRGRRRSGPEGQDPPEPRKRPERPRGSATGNAARTKGCWAASATPSRDARPQEQTRQSRHSESRVSPRPAPGTGS